MLRWSWRLGGARCDRIAECGAADDATGAPLPHPDGAALAHCHARVYHRDLKPENILLDGADKVSRSPTLYRGAPRSPTRRGGVPSARRSSVTTPPSSSHRVRLAHVRGARGGRRVDEGVGVRRPPLRPTCGRSASSRRSRCGAVGRAPFGGGAAPAARFALVQQRGSARVLCEANGFSPDATALIEQMLALDPRRRLSAADVLKFPWVGDYQTPPAPSVLAHQSGARSSVTRRRRASASRG